MQGFSYSSAIVLVGIVLLALVLGVLGASPLFAIALTVVGILAFLVTRSARRRAAPGQARTPSTGEAAAPGPQPVTPKSRERVVTPTPDPEVDHRSAESFPASDPPATY